MVNILKAVSRGLLRRLPQIQKINLVVTPPNKLALWFKSAAKIFAVKKYCHMFGRRPPERSEEKGDWKTCGRASSGRIAG
ncbi:hypothetical protein POF51_27835 [Brevibacillus sp. AG]|uniref:hypothetical protein n=1 Tax=Brevibacillus sp. AG TaxID=3020891 RepID=UPI000852E454|nr:hypothetical protein [Brevibacillus sp. AG]MDC0764540.1 hypothetical protein [Brevibacillus sp. AG]